MEFKEHVKCFTKLLEDRHVAEFLKRDQCCALCDKYHLVIIFQYFMRAGFREEDYKPRAFFLALILSHDIYEESKALKEIITQYYLNRNDGSIDKSKKCLSVEKLRLFHKMQFKGYVEKKVCQSLLHLLPQEASQRNRKELHTGVIIDNQIICDKCKCPINTTFGTRSRKNDADTNDTSVDESISKTPRDIEDVSDMILNRKAKKKRLRRSDEIPPFFRESETPFVSENERSSLASIC